MSSVTTTLDTDCDVTWDGDDVTAPERRVLNQLYHLGSIHQEDVPDEVVGTLERRGMVLVFQGRLHLTERGSNVVYACRR